MKRFFIVIFCGVIVSSCGNVSMIANTKPYLSVKTTIVLEKDFVKIIEGDDIYYLEYDDDRGNWSKSYRKWVRAEKRN